MSGIQLIEVRVRNFRSLKQVDVKLDELTVLIGENNSGKTGFLEALFTAIGSGRRTISPEDIYLSPSENKVPKDRMVTIDILIRPVDVDNEGKVIENFPEGSFWLEIWGIAISQDDQDNDFIAIRTQIKWDSTRGEYVTERRFLQDWQIDPNNWNKSIIKENAGFVTSSHIEPLSFYLMDAKRDIQDEMYARNSFWHKLVSNPGLTDEKVESLEENLAKLNEDITTSSEVFRHIEQSLNELHQTVASDQGSVSITPIARNLRNLSKGIDVTFATKDAQTFPLIRHGMGTRSLAALLIFHAYTTWRQKNAEVGTIHPMLALEEPEAHLHPQAQRSLFKQIGDIPGQRIVSTHSPYIASQAHISSFRHFRKNGADTVVTQLDTTSLEPEDIRKIDRMVMNTRGDILYSRAVVLFEGETEEQALPFFAEKYWERHINSLGISFIGVDGSGNYLPFLRLVSNFQIPWYLFSDTEPTAVKDVTTALRNIGIDDYTQHSNIVFLPENQNFESYLVDEEYEDAILAMLDIYYDTVNYLDTDYIIRMHGQKAKGGTVRDYQLADGRKKALIDVLTNGKTQYGLPIAKSITDLQDEERRFPKKIRQLFEKISDDIGLQKR
ncbi:ATP-dependent nuclease [Nostoc sp. CCY0012]|uniref:ATP-dependent nuclease n=1 Tax=Nostoc sp. CCY0012 TaxID=1056123 RepID=UPI0039C6B0C0